MDSVFTAKRVGFEDIASGTVLGRKVGGVSEFERTGDIIRCFDMSIRREDIGYVGMLMIAVVSHVRSPFERLVVGGRRYSGIKTSHIHRCRIGFGIKTCQISG